jgi:D-alanyl-lipoteichoic acid acyltransferase DltB (MBOAT superfamily)
MVALLKTVGLQPHELTLHILLPVGISFYTFQSLAYTWDVYRRQMQACPSFITYASYLSFFPQLVAGPIERAKHLLPQIATPRTWSVDHLHVGCRQILVGFFQKVFVADHCALIANYVFDSTTPLNGAWATLGAVAFAFQIYGDFAGYTNIARGSARLMGVELSKNFLFPYFAHAPSDFWQRWHISLSSWFRDYVYIPLGGNRGTHGRTLLNLLVTMFLAGLWHGASWMFVLWGVYHGVLLVVYRTALPLRWLEEQAPRFLAIACMSLLTLFGWVIFRSTTPEIFLHWCSAWTQPSALALSWSKPAAWVALHVLPLLLLQIITWKQRDETNLQHLAWGWRTVIYLLLVVAITSATSSEQEFIYFQF